MRRHHWLLLGVVVGFLVFRVPFLWWQLGGQDEDLLSVGGLTLAREGVPRLAYIESDNSSSFYHGADTAILFYPPGGFFAQAAFFLWLPPSHATARLPSMTTAVVCILLVYALARRAYGPMAGVLAAAIFALSRGLFFVAVTSRPDALCAMFGLWALVWLWDWRDSGGWSRLTAAGICLALGLFTHPFAIVYCLLCGFFVLSAPGGWRRRISSAGWLTGLALGGIVLWLPYILRYPEQFRDQFFQNVVNRVPGSLLGRLAWPWPYVPIQWRLMREHFGDPQLTVLSLGVLLSIWRAWRSGRWTVPVLTLGSVYLLCGFLGTYVTKMYWCLPTALACVAGAGAADSLMSKATASPLCRRMAGAMIFLALVGYLPQSGIRMWWNYIDSDRRAPYDGPAFVRSVLSQTPIKGRYAVDTNLVFDFWLAGRDTRLQEELEIEGGRQYEYDWLLVGRNGLSKSVPERMGGEFVRRFGDGDDPLACYAELYRIPRPDEKP